MVRDYIGLDTPLTLVTLLGHSCCCSSGIACDDPWSHWRWPSGQAHRNWAGCS